jgi:hypothetical protein
LAGGGFVFLPRRKPQQGCESVIRLWRQRRVHIILLPVQSSAEKENNMAQTGLQTKFGHKGE